MPAADSEVASAPPLVAPIEGGAALAVRQQWGDYWLFTGDQRDSESELYYLRARYYDPAIGEFLTQDAAHGRRSCSAVAVRGEPVGEADALRHGRSTPTA